MKYTLVVLLCCMRTTVNGNKAQSVAQSVAETFGKCICFPSRRTKIADDDNKCLQVSSTDYAHVKVRDGAYLFYWLRRKVTRKAESHPIPLAIFLEGGPGGSGTSGANFGAIGPCDINLDEERYAWVNHMHVLFIDSPVGVGFSYVTENNYARSDDDVAQDLLVLLDDFFKKHETLRTAPLHIFGSSYGAKAAFGLAWSIKRGEPTLVCNLKSVSSISGWVSPIDSVQAYGPLLQNLGFIDKHGVETIADIARRVVSSENDINALKTEVELTDTVQKFFFVDLYNWMNIKDMQPKSTVDESKSELAIFMMKTVSKALKLSKERKWKVWNQNVRDALGNDNMKPVAHLARELAKTIKVNIVTGQYDLVCSTPSTIRWVERLVETGWEIIGKNYGQHTDPKRGIITVENMLEGYFMKYKNITMYTVLDAGHSLVQEKKPIMNIILQKIIGATPNRSP